MSGDRQTIHFKDFLDNYEQLFYELEERLVSKTARNTWYELCGHPIPHPPDQEQCTKDFHHLDNEWKRRVLKYGELSTAKYFRKRDVMSALYLVVVHARCHRHEMCSNKSTRWVTCLVEFALSMRIMSL